MLSGVSSVVKKSQDLIWCARRLSREGFPKVIYGFEGGIGDELLLTTVLRHHRLTQGEPAAVLSRWPEIFEGNPNVRTVFRREHNFEFNAHWFGCLPTWASYAPWDSRRDETLAIPQRHIVALTAKSVGMRGRIEVRPEMWLTRNETEEASFAKGALVIQSTVSGAKYPMVNKEWGVSRMAEVCRILSRKAEILQIGAPNDPLLPGARDCRGAGIRRTAAILSQAHLFVGLVGFLMHLARSVDCPAVIVYGGRERPWQSGYSCNINVARTPPCSPCWKFNSCAYDRACLSDIGAREVCESVDALWADIKDLAVDFEDI